MGDLKCRVQGECFRQISPTTIEYKVGQVRCLKIVKKTTLNAGDGYGDENKKEPLTSF
jgi:hypothetical protein